MSYWFYKKDESGKHRLFAVDVPFPAIIMLFGMLAAFFMPRQLHLHELATFGFDLISIGFFLLLISKISLFSRAIWISWGPRFMSGPFKWAYWAGYVFIGIGILLTIVITSMPNETPKAKQVRAIVPFVSSVGHIFTNIHEVSKYYEAQGFILRGRFENGKWPAKVVYEKESSHGISFVLKNGQSHVYPPHVGTRFKIVSLEDKTGGEIMVVLRSKEEERSQ